MIIILNIIEIICENKVYFGFPIEIKKAKKDPETDMKIKLIDKSLIISVESFEKLTSKMILAKGE